MGIVRVSDDARQRYIKVGHGDVTVGVGRNARGGLAKHLVPADAADAADADATDAEAAYPPTQLSRQESLSLLQDTDEAKEAERQMYQNHTALLLSFGVFGMFSAVWSVWDVKTAVLDRD